VGIDTAHFLHHRRDIESPPCGTGRALLVVHAVLIGVLLHGGPAGVQGVGGGGQGARLHHFLSWVFAGFHCVRGGGRAGFLGELGNGFAEGVLGGVVALHLLHVLGGGIAGGVRIIVRTVSRAHGVLGS
jgi:hypothetical protein